MKLYSLAIRVQVSDENNASIDGNFTVLVTNENEAPFWHCYFFWKYGCRPNFNRSNLSDPDGIGTVTYQWLRNGQQISLGVTLKDGINGVDGLDDPRVLAISPDGKNIYVVGLEDAVSWYDFNMSSGVLNFSGILRNGISGVDGLDNAIDIEITPDGKFAYIVGYVNDSISWFSRDTTDGSLNFSGIVKDDMNGVDGLNGSFTLDFSADYKHVYVAAQNDSAISWFERNETTGALNFLGVIKNGLNGLGARSIKITHDDKL